VALSCFQPRRVPVGFGAAPSGKAPGIAPPAAFSRYKDLHRSRFSHFPLSFFHISLPSPRSFSYCKGLRPHPAAYLASTDHRRSLCLDLWVRYCAGGLSLRDYIAATLTLALSQPTYLVLRLEPVIQTSHLIRRLVYPPLPCRPARDDPFSGHTGPSLRSALPFWNLLPSPFPCPPPFHHRSADLQSCHGTG